MGICTSHGFSEIQENNDRSENLVFIDKALHVDGVARLASLHSQQGHKGTNQDAAILYQGFEGKGAFCGVFDGHGMYGHLVSNIVMKRLSTLITDQKNAFALEELGEESDGGSSVSINEWRRACVSAFKVMDKELKLQGNFDCYSSGSTAVTIILQGEDLVIANLGDSRAILGTMSQTDGLVALQLTTDLTPDLPHEAERIKMSSGRVFALENEAHIQRVWLPNEEVPGLAMTRSFGDFLLKDYGVIAIPQMSHRRMTKNDQFVVLATDGVWNVLSNDEVASIVWSAPREDVAAAQAVVDAAVAAWKSKFPCSNMDDCTAVCLFLQNREKD
ncbi:hypothetical protein Syun_011353 [Stephania yunnanensis]|uniref:PPM-type phosphatase domain-containing protein n=1 Tax=Stephania yunnanensis TaxID=152371 RepID=A0AAP0PEB4_9MAGN